MNNNARILLLAGVLGLTSSAALSQFTPRASPEPLVRGLRVVANVPAPGSTTLYATSFGGGMSKGVDDGTTITWAPFATSLPTTRLFAHSFVNDTTFYVLTDGYGVQKTTDGGVTFAGINGSGPTELGCRRVRNLTRIGPDLYVGTSCSRDSGVWKSVDEGLNWTRLGVGTFPGDVAVYQFINGGAFFLAATSKGVYRSADGGATWAASYTGMAGTLLAPEPNVFSIACGTSCATFMLANAQGSGIYKSVDAGLTRTSSGTGLPANTPFLAGITRDPVTTTTFYVAIDGAGVYESTDNANTWNIWGNTDVEDQVRNVRAVLRDASVAGKFYVTKFDGVSRTLNSGGLWYSAPMGRGTYNSVAHDPQNSATAYAVGATLYRIPNIAAPAPVIHSGGLLGLMNDGALYQFGGTSGDTMYATTNNFGVYKSTDRGLNWAPVNTGLPFLVGQSGRLAFNRVNPQIIYFGSTGNPSIGVYKTSDGGANWYEANIGLTGDARSINRIFVDRFTPSTLYAATDAGVYKSTDSAGSWSVLYSVNDGGGNPLPVGHIFQGFAAAGELYISNSHVEPNGTQLPSSGVLKSLNGGATWTNTLPRRAQNLRVLNGTVLIAGLADGPGQPAVMRSADKGVTWQNISAGLTGYDIRTFGASSDNGAVLSATLENGFFTMNGTQSLQFAPANYIVAESVGSIALTVTRTGGTTGTASVQYETRTTGSATSGSDFTATTGTLNFAAGIATLNFTVPIANDSSIEGGESFPVRLFNPSNLTGTVALGAPSVASVAITDNDSTFQFTAPTIEVNENGPNVTLIVSRAGSVATAASVNWATLNGTALAGQDFGTALSAIQRSGVLSWAAGDGSSKTITIGPTATAGAYVPVINDSLIEGIETFTVRLTSATGATLGAQVNAMVSIVSEERGVAMASPTASALEAAGSVTVTVGRSGPSSGEVTVNYAFANGSAQAGTHYTAVPGTLTWPDGDNAPKQIVVPIASDSVTNAARTFTVSLAGALGATLGAASSTTVSILDDDNTLQFASPTATVAEGVATLTLNVTRVGYAAEAATVNWSTANGNAVAGSDFGTSGNPAALTGTLNWGVNDIASKPVTIAILNDTVVEGAKTFTVTLADPVGANLGSVVTVNATINDNDSGVLIAQPTYTVVETGPALVVTVNRVGPAAAAASVTWTTANGTAISGTHFGVAGSGANRTGLLSWLAGTSTPKTITIPILNNAIADGDRTFTITLSAPSPGLVIGAPGTTTATILDDDIPPQSTLTFAPQKVPVVENNGTVTLTVTRTNVGGGFGLAASVNYATAPGSAAVASDYTTKSGVLTWPAGDSSLREITINITNDAVPESPEQFKVNLSGATPGTSVTTPSATVLILDDDEIFPLDGVIPTGWVMPALGANATWHVSNDPGAFDGAFSLRTDMLGDNETAGIEFTGTFNPGPYSFRVKVSSELGYDVLRFYLDGTLMAEWSGTTNTTWQLYSGSVPGGLHTFRWSYGKDGSASLGQDAAWLDGVVLPPLAP